ncbi:MAG: site-specific integrase [Candidatus Methanomethylophilaceae archaeon]|nr:site-specific integrase [Candidatus Methanomethylophilaceae archaeon]
MSTYPFKEKAQEYLLYRKGIIAESSYKELDRRLRRIEREMIALRDKGEMSTLSPTKMSPDDIKAYILYRKARKVSASDLEHDIGTLNQMLLFFGNPAVTQCIQRNLGIKPRRSSQRLDPLPEDVYKTILAKWKEIDLNDFPQVRAFAMVLMYIGTGARNKELRLCRRSDVNTDTWTIHFAHVKGEDSYGIERSVPIPDAIKDVVSEYLYHRDVYLAAHNATSEALFFQLGGEHTFLSSNSVRKIKQRVENAVGYSFELRDCRREFGQYYRDRGLEIDKVSRLMGHATTRTTELYYAGVSQSEAIKGARGLW